MAACGRPSAPHWRPLEAHGLMESSSRFGGQWRLGLGWPSLALLSSWEPHAAPACLSTRG
eukprot:scaffold161343_cov31-Tisochrysis_lutea.AAC.1